MDKPKNDAARRAWLAGLKSYDDVTWVDDRGEVRVGGVIRGHDYFALIDGSTRNHHFTLATGKAQASHYTQTTGWLIPVTDAHRRVQAVRDARRKLQDACRSSGLLEFSDAQVLACAAILWPVADTQEAPLPTRTLVAVQIRR